MMPYHPHRVHATFRGYWDYDGGGLGDMGQHYLDPVQYLLDKTTRAPSRSKPIPIRRIKTQFNSKKSNFKEEKMTVQIILTLTPEQGDKIRELAEKDGVTPNQWCKAIVLAAAEKKLK
jgi:predicted dehydrogenase